MSFEVASVKPNAAPMSQQTVAANVSMGPGDYYAPTGGLFSATDINLFSYHIPPTIDLIRLNSFRATLREPLVSEDIMRVQKLVLLTAVAVLESAAITGVSKGNQQPRLRNTIAYEHDGNSEELEVIAWPTSDIYMMSADGANQTQLTNDGHSHSASWSPDGRQILFIHDKPFPSAYPQVGHGFDHYPIELHVMNRDGSDNRLLRDLQARISSAACSPDGRFVACTCRARRSELASASTTTRGLQRCFCCQ